MYRIAAALLVSLILSVHAQAQTVDCGPAVTPDGSSLQVASDPGNDTENLQCALDKAVAENYTSVLLLDASYSIGEVTATGFEGRLSGRSSTATTVTIEAGSVDCSAADASAVRFYVGAPTVSRMSINAEELCGATGERAAVIGFYSNAADCSKRTALGNVDRVVMQGPGRAAFDIITGVSMTNADACDSKVLGTLKVNRSSIDGLAVGVLSSIGGAGQVDINFNDFTNMGTSIALLNANQGSSIAGNTINYNDAEDFALETALGKVGIFIGGDASSPSSNLSSLKNNKFFNGGATDNGYAVLIGQLDNKIGHTVWISSNQFNGVDIAEAATARAPYSGASAQASNTDQPTDPIEFSSGFEETENLVTGTGPLVGWRAYINVFTSGCTVYNYGYEYSALGSGVAVVADGAGSKVLNVYSDYDNPDSGAACLESNVFREYALTAGNIGSYTLTYDVELAPEEFRGADVEGFIKVLDPDAGYADIGGVTPVASTEGGKQLEITLTDDMVGKLLQFGFATTVNNDDPSGMYYDNVVFKPSGSSGGGGDSGGGDSGGGSGGGSDSPTGGSGYGVAATNTDGVLVSGNTFRDGATAWVATDAVGDGIDSVAGWSIVDNTFNPSTALADISLGASTSGAVVGRSQDTPSVLDSGNNDVLEGASASGDTAAIATDIGTVFDQVWQFLANP